MTVRAHTNAVIAALETIGPPVGDAKAPDANPPYYVVYPLPGQFDGNLADPDEDVMLAYQVTCVGRSREQAEGLADAARTVMAALTVTGRNIQRVIPDTAGGTLRDDDDQPPVFTVPDRYTVWSTP